MRIAIGADHAGFLLKQHLIGFLTAQGHARQQGGRSGVYDIEVVNQDGKPVALFRGRSTRIKGPIFENESDNP